MKCGDQSKFVIATCNSISKVNADVIGDSLEVNAFAAINAKINEDIISVDK